jgi:hypothetical protein
MFNLFSKPVNPMIEMRAFFEPARDGEKDVSRLWNYGLCFGRSCESDCGHFQLPQTERSFIFGSPPQKV